MTQVGLLCGCEEQAGFGDLPPGVYGNAHLVDLNWHWVDRRAFGNGGLWLANPEQRLSVGLGAQPVRGFSVKP